LGERAQNRFASIRVQCHSPTASPQRGDGLPVRDLLDFTLHRVAERAMASNARRIDYHHARTESRHAGEVGDIECQQVRHAVNMAHGH
jgi:hypothetical protein